MRAHAEWKVITHIARARPPTRPSTRSRISCAALLVNVMARISLGRACAAAHEVGDPVGEHARLARAGAGEDQQRSLAVQHGLALRARSGPREGSSVAAGAPTQTRIGRTAGVADAAQRSRRAKAARAAAPTSTTYAADHSHSSGPPSWAPPKGPSWTITPVAPLTSDVRASRPRLVERLEGQQPGGDARPPFAGSPR